MAGVSILLCLLALVAAANAFLSKFKHVPIRASPLFDQKDVIVTVDVPMDFGLETTGAKDLPIQFRPIFSKSEFFVVTYDVPFGLNVDKPPKNFPSPIVTKDGTNGEKVGDVLRATSCWSQGFNAAGATSDIMSFAGNVKWRRSVFDTTGAPWDKVVEALVSNTAERCRSVSLVFERELEDDEEIAEPASE